MTGITNTESRSFNFYFQSEKAASRVDQMERVLDRGGVHVLFRTADNDGIAISCYLGIYALEEFVFYFFFIHILFFNRLDMTVIKRYQRIVG